MESGKHTLQLVAGEHKSDNKTIDVPAGQNVWLKVSLSK